MSFGSINNPLQILCGPVKAVRVEVLLRCLNILYRCSIIVTGKSLAKVVGESLSTWGSKIGARKLPIDLILTVRKQNRRRDDTSAVRDQHFDVHSAISDIEISPYVWCLTSTVKPEFSSFGAKCNISVVGEDPSIG